MSTSIAPALASMFARKITLVPNVAGERKRRAAVIECAHKKGTGSTKNGRDSNPQYLGVKKYGEEKVTVGSIIVRQVGNKFHAGEGVGTGRDFTLFALREGEVRFRVGANKKKYVTVVDGVDRSGREDGAPTRKDERRAMYTPRAVVREALERGEEVPKRAATATRAAATARKTRATEAATRKKTLARTGSAAAPKGFYRQVSKVRYCNLSLLLMDEIMETNGVIVKADAEKFYEHMLDGPGVTPTELASLEFVLNGGGGPYTYVTDAEAKAFLAEKIAQTRGELESDAGAR